MRDTYEELAAAVEDNGMADTLATLANIAEDELENPALAEAIRALVATMS